MAGLQILVIQLLVSKFVFALLVNAGSAVGGNLQAEVPATMLPYPYGESYCFPNRPKERTRFSDGRLTIYFISFFTSSDDLNLLVLLTSCALLLNRIQYYAGGARNIVIFNIPSEGCTPVLLTLFAGRGPYDEFGCLINYNAADQAHNEMLNPTILEYQERWQDAHILLFDFYSATIEIAENPEMYGRSCFRRDVLLRACCGCFGPYNYNPLYECGEPRFIPDPNSGPNGWVNGSRACPDPEHRVLGQNALNASFQPCHSGILPHGPGYGRTTRRVQLEAALRPRLHPVV
uniref:Uncharacterized protein n=1 Tax=Physcomitrium patens TaxID=3218 RepID=A0A2K1IJR0_PHYPA|nr:hypothetical protein PHYPA_028211 [Physcomitrium patens]